MNASLLILTLAIGANDAARPVERQNGLAGVIANTAAPSRTSRDGANLRENRRVRRVTAESRRERPLAGGRSNASQLMGLIQTTIEPDSWQTPVGGGGFGPAGGGGGASPRMRLIDLIHEIEPESWDINGGPGSIGVFAP